jgi:hypothetical protein
MRLEFDVCCYSHKRTLPNSWTYFAQEEGPQFAGTAKAMFPRIGQTADTYGHVAPERHEAAVAGPDRYLTV